MITLALFVSLLLAVTRRYSALECPETWKEFEGFCYKVMDRLGYRRRFAWSTALSGCFGFGGDLVSISNEKEMKFVHDMAFKDANRTSVWIGLTYRHQKGGYVWNNGESFNFSVSVQWLNMSRIVYENKCVEILKNGWNLTECCKENKHLLCKRSKGPLACSAYWFLNGVSCYKENNKDTWEGAQQGCTASGGDLVKGDDDNQKRFLIHFMEVTGLKKPKIDHVWIGRKDDSNCLQMERNTGKIEKAGDCNDEKNYICEMPASTTSCYEYPSRNFSVPIKVSCTFPENLCFKYENTMANGEQVTIQGCISADQCTQFDDHHLHCCEGDLCNSVKNTKTENPTRAISKVIYISLGITSAFLLLSVAIVVWCYRRKKLKTIERSPDSQPPDKWEMLPEQIEFGGELGRGEFGFVYKATVRKRDEMEALVTETSKWPSSSTKPKAPQVVAVKVLHDDPSEAQIEEFTFEIEQMKMLGSHKNVVSMVGCCTLEEKMFLVIEYVPCGDLLTWLRRRRKKINERKASERSYADKEVLKDQGETRDKQKQAGKPLKKTAKEEQAEVTMEMISLHQIVDPKDMASATHSLPDQRFAFNSEAMDDEHSANKEQVNIAQQSDKDAVLEVIPSTSATNQDVEWKVTEKDWLLSSQAATGKSQANPSPAMPPVIESTHEDLSSDEEDAEENFRAKQLFSFAWQIAKGMNHLAENNLVHRDLAARNVLVGHDNQIKVSDFGLMRQIYEDVRSSAKSKKLPVKWMASEALYQGLYTTKSDVPLAKGFEQLRPGVIGFSQGRRHGKVEMRPFALSSPSKKKRGKVMLMQ